MALRDLVPWRREESRLAPRQEENPFLSLRREMDDLFEDFFRDWTGSVGSLQRRSEAFVPRVNVTENEKSIDVSAELPGMDEKDIDVTVERDSLILKGEKRMEHEDKDGGRTYYESSYGSFQRIIPLPEEIDEDKIQAEFKKGVLHITMPKSEEASAGRKKVAIKSG